MKIGLTLEAPGCFEPTEAAAARRREVYAAGVAKLKEQVIYLGEVECVFIPWEGIATFRCDGILKTDRLKGRVV